MGDKVIVREMMKRVGVLMVLGSVGLIEVRNSNVFYFMNLCWFGFFFFIFVLCSLLEILGLVG